jgi:hypothetical protein
MHCCLAAETGQVPWSPFTQKCQILAQILQEYLVTNFMVKVILISVNKLKYINNLNI